MSDNLMDKVSQLGERLKIGGAEMGQKISSGMSSVTFKVKEFFQGPNEADKLVEEATSETLDEPDWATNLELCDMVNHERVNSVEFIRGIRKRIILKNPRVQYLALVLLETVVKNSEKAFSEVAAERVLDDLVNIIDDPQTLINNRNKALMLIESWGESSDELRYLPVYEETYKSLQLRGIRFPRRDNETLAPLFTPARSVESTDSYAPLPVGEEEQLQYDIPVRRFSAEQTKEAFDVAQNSLELLNTVLSSYPQQDALQDDLVATLLHQCRESQYTVQRIIETAGDNEVLLFEALNLNDEIQKTLSKYEDIRKRSELPPPMPEPATIPVAIEPDDSSITKEDVVIRKTPNPGTRNFRMNNDEMMDDLDEMIFGKKPGNSSTPDTAEDAKKKQGSSSNDLISF